MQELNNVIIAPDASIAEAIAHLDKAGTGALVLCQTDGMVCGLLTDGDIRRAVLQAKSLQAQCGEVATATPVTALAPLSSCEALRLMNCNGINHLPVIDENGRLQAFLSRKDLVTEDAVQSRSRERLEKSLILSSASISEAIARLEKAGTGALLLCSTDGKLAGLLTDGDVRRSILQGRSMDSECAAVASREPVTANWFVSAAEALRLMNEHDVDQLPVLDADGKAVELLLREDFVPEDDSKLTAVIMAGGFGKRLLPLTEHLPKPMLPVGERPLLEHTIQMLIRAGIRDVHLATHYLHDGISNHFGDGKDFGVRLHYMQEKNPLGTAGGLKLMPRTKGPFLVINGDILTGVSYQQMLRYHLKNQAEMTIGVRKYEMTVPFGIVECEENKVTHLVEKPSYSFFINAGTYLLEPSICDLIPTGRRFDMTELIEQLIEVGRRVISFPIMEYWLDVGSPEDYERARTAFANGTFTSK